MTAHGTRRQYLRGCRCLPCAAANAAYLRDYMRERRQGAPPRLGSAVSIVDTWRQIRQLQCEQFTKAAIARALGVQRLRLELYAGGRVTLRNACKVRRLCRDYLAISADRVSRSSPAISE